MSGLLTMREELGIHATLREVTNVRVARRGRVRATVPTRAGSTPHLERMISVPMQPGSPRPAETNLSSNRRPIQRVRTSAADPKAAAPQPHERDEQIRLNPMAAAKATARTTHRSMPRRLVSRLATR